ncbi:hypothetical protein GEMRC1_013742 [Eukaryota sp. GEM-RC1]
MSIPYSRNPLYADLTEHVIPPTNGPNPIAPINFSDEFIDVMGYFNCLIQRSELSKRSLDITLDVIRLNPANYTAWHFRRRCLLHLKYDLRQELDDSRVLARSNPKNYQVWYHRQALLDSINDQHDELSFLSEMLHQDAKNYHVWTLRQWILTRFTLEDSVWRNELEFLEDLLISDIFNYSAWSHRRLVVKHLKIDFVQECCYSLAKIKQVPTNESSWMYLKGLRVQAELPEEVMEYTRSLGNTNRFAALLLAEDCECRGESSNAEMWFKVLASIDSIRKDFWLYEAERIKTL